MNIKRGGCCNLQEHKEINNGEQYISLDVSLELGFLENRKVTSSEPRYYVEISVKGMNSCMTLKIRRMSKNKQKAKTATTDVALQNFVEILEKLNMYLI